jgi:hypothetical protein
MQAIAKRSKPPMNSRGLSFEEGQGTKWGRKRYLGKYRCANARLEVTCYTEVMPMGDSWINRAPDSHKRVSQFRARARIIPQPDKMTPM